MNRLCALFTWATVAIFIANLQAEEVKPILPCDRCGGQVLKGETIPHPESKWGIISDLPESISGHGVLYCTDEILPRNGDPETLRHQLNNGQFTGIDGSFDVFLFHTLKGPISARLVVYVINDGAEAVTLEPKQIIKSDGEIGAVHEFESDLGKRLLKEDWDTFRPDHVRIPPGEGRVIAYGKQFGSSLQNGEDSSNNVNCFGYVRAHVLEGNRPKLAVYIVAIPASEPSELETKTQHWLAKGAPSSDSVRMDRPPVECAVGRAVGVYPNFIWQNRPFTIDTATLESTEGTTWTMALPEVQSAACADARQTTDLALRPAYTRPDTIGNYMIEHRVAIEVTNSKPTSIPVELYFGKEEADVGLAYAIAVLSGKASPADIDFSKMKLPYAEWAGPKQSSRSKVLGTPVTLGPGETRTICVRFVICGNSSLPFYLGVRWAR